MTDGCGESTNIVMNYFDDLIISWNSRGIESRIFAVGISKQHNAELLSKLAGAGSDLGNFV